MVNSSTCISTPVCKDTWLWHKAEPKLKGHRYSREACCQYAVNLYYYWIIIFIIILNWRSYKSEFPPGMIFTWSFSNDISNDSEHVNTIAVITCLNIGKAIVDMINNILFELQCHIKYLLRTEPHKQTDITPTSRAGRVQMRHNINNDSIPLSSVSPAAEAESKKHIPGTEAAKCSLLRVVCFWFPAAMQRNICKWKSSVVDVCLLAAQLWPCFKRNKSGKSLNQKCWWRKCSAVNSWMQRSGESVEAGI